MIMGMQSTKAQNKKVMTDTRLKQIQIKKQKHGAKGRKTRRRLLSVRMLVLVTSTGHGVSSQAPCKTRHGPCGFGVLNGWSDQCQSIVLSGCFRSFLSLVTSTAHCGSSQAPAQDKTRPIGFWCLKLLVRPMLVHRSFRLRQKLPFYIDSNTIRLLLLLRFYFFSCSFSFSFRF